jgi:hypothetical protein
LAPNRYAMVGMFSTCRRLGEWASQLLDKNDFWAIAILSTALIDMYAPFGSLVHDWEAFNGMKVKVVWQAIIFIGFLCGYTHVGPVAYGHRYLDSLNRVFSLTPKIVPCGCMVNLLGRAGLVDEAPEVLKGSETTGVFSFGVARLEVAYGRSPIERKLGGLHRVKLVDWGWTMHSQGKLIEAAVTTLTKAFAKSLFYGERGKMFPRTLLHFTCTVWSLFSHDCMPGDFGCLCGLGCCSVLARFKATWRAIRYWLGGGPRDGSWFGISSSHQHELGYCVDAVGSTENGVFCCFFRSFVFRLVYFIFLFVIFHPHLEDKVLLKGGAM